MTSPENANAYSAQVFEKPGQPLVARQFVPPRLKEHEVLVRVRCCTLCGSDLHTFQGQRSAHTPLILGHEILGEVLAIGAGQPSTDLRGEELRLGDRVTWAVVASCGRCFLCTHDLPQKCESLFKYGHESCAAAHPFSGGLAEVCHLAVGTAILKVPPTLPDIVAASANCATATAAAALRISRGCEGQIILIQGAGLLGLTLAAMANVGNAARIIVADPDPVRLELAKAFGATDIVKLTAFPETLQECVRQCTAGRGVDLAFEMSGAHGAVESGLANLRIGGEYILVGAVKPVGQISLEPELIVRRMLTIKGVHNYAPRDLLTAVDFLTAHQQRYPFHKLVAESFPLAESQQAFQHMLAHKSVRVAIVQ